MKKVNVEDLEIGKLYMLHIPEEYPWTIDGKHTFCFIGVQLENYKSGLAKEKLYTIVKTTDGPLTIRWTDVIYGLEQE